MIVIKYSVASGINKVERITKEDQCYMRIKCRNLFFFWQEYFTLSFFAGSAWLLVTLPQADSSLLCSLNKCFLRRVHSLGFPHGCFGGITIYFYAVFLFEAENRARICFFHTLPAPITSCKAFQNKKKKNERKGKKTFLLKNESYVLCIK